MTAIELYRHEKALYERRHAPIIAAAREQLRAAIARIEGNSPMADARAKGRRERVNARNRARAKDFKPQFGCGHPRTIENTYTSKRGDRNGEPNRRCKTCAHALNAKRYRPTKGALAAGSSRPYAA